MGSGRARAKQAKVARELKYSARDVDFEALNQELSTSGEPAESDRRHEREGLPSQEDYERWS